MHKFWAHINSNLQIIGWICMGEAYPMRRDAEVTPVASSLLSLLRRNIFCMSGAPYISFGDISTPNKNIIDIYNVESGVSPGS